MFPVVELDWSQTGMVEVVSLGFSSRPPRYGVRPAVRYPWHYPGGNWWPHDAAGEARFVEDATAASDGRHASKFDRGDVTMLITALRSGATYAEWEQNGFLTRPERLVAAHSAISSRIETSKSAWGRLLDGSQEHFEQAAMLMPAAASQLRVFRTGPRRQTTVDRIVQAGTTARETVDLLFSALQKIPPRTVEGVELGRMLFNGDEFAMFMDPYLLPERCGELGPSRIDTITAGWFDES